jgi:RimJ/RimL family protein N-acetyltransferase
LSGRPEARYEAYARAYAGCGPYTTHPYRCSYARRCENWACHSHETNDRHNILFDERPYDLLGQYVRLEALDIHRHAAALFQVTTGTALAGHKSFDPQEIWAFQPEGPFATIAELERSFLFPSSSSTDHHAQQHHRSAAFAMVDMVTDALVGVIRLTNDDPYHLSVQLEPPILPPQYQKSMKQLEACFLLLDRLFALGYRRIQLSIDTQDIDGQQLAQRLWCVLEGILRKHKVIKDANRDSKIYSLINSDWKTTVRAQLFGILYGASMLAYDRANESFETEQEEKEEFAQQREKQPPVAVAAAVAQTQQPPQQLETKKLV